MRLHELKPAPGSHRPRKRLGRGNATGQGTTAGKGTKGEKARSGGLKAGFRGMSSRNQRMAKRRGFTNIFKTEYEVVNLDQLGRFERGATVDVAALKQAGLVAGSRPVKILGRGELAIPLSFVEVRVSQSAREKIERAGGTVAGAISQEDGAAAAPGGPATGVVTTESAAPETPVEIPVPVEVVAEVPATEEPAAPHRRSRRPAAAEPVEPVEPTETEE